MSEKNVPSVFAVTGGQETLRRRFLQGILKVWVKEGRTIKYADGSDSGDLANAMAVGGSIFEDDDQQMVVVVSNPEKVDIELLKQHAAVKDNDVILVLDHPGEPRGNTRFGIFVKGMAKAHSNWPVPPFWKADEVAAEFCVTEAKSYGKVFPPQLAGALVRRVSADLGFLSFEVLKLATLADIEKTDTITPEHVKGGMSPILQATVNPLLDSLAARNQGDLLSALDRIRKTSKDDPTIRISRLMWASISKWLAVADLNGKGVTPDDAASRLGIQPWLYREKILPQVQRWPRKDVVKLVQVLAGAERAVFNGCIDPWAVLVTGLVGVCGGAR